MHLKMYQTKFIYTTPLLLTIPIIITSCSALQPIIDDQNKEKEKEDEDESQIIPDDINVDNADQIFPKMNVNEYYKYVEFIDHKPVITDQMVVQFIKDVIKKIATSKGEISFVVNKKNPSNVEINFKWQYKDKTLYKNYIINIK